MTYVFIEEVQATVTRNEGGDLLVVLDKLYTNALTNSRVRLLSLNTQLLQNDSLGVRSSSERVRLPDGSQVSLLVLLIGPSVIATVQPQVASSPDSTWFTNEGR